MADGGAHSRQPRPVIRPGWPLAAAVSAVVLVVVVVVAVTVSTQGTKAAPKVPLPKSSAKSSTTPSARHPKTKRIVPATYLSADGVVARSIVAENQLPGTTAWQIAPHTGPDGIEGFGNLNYAQVGNQLSLYVSTPAPQFSVVAYRMGWYQGLGGRQVWQSASVAGQVQPACPVTPQINMVSCDNWAVSITIPITAAFVPGDYLLKLVGSGGQQGYVPLTVWNPSSTATYLIMNRSFVEEGWNAYGGYSYYQGVGPCTLGSGPYPICNRARVVSFDRPFDVGDGASDFLANEYPLLRFCEQHGLDVTYATDVTIDEHPTFLSQHKVLLSLGHDESWSYSERVGAELAEARGMNVVFFGAASVLRHVRLQPSPLGLDREEVDYRDSTEDPLYRSGDPNQVTGNTWSSPPTDLPETSFVGENYSGYLQPGTSAPFVVSDASSWLYKGTGLQNGATLPGVIQSDIDHVTPSPDTPADIEVLGHSPVPLNITYTNQGKWGPFTYSDFTYYTDPSSKAGVIDTGDNDWINALDNCPAGVPTCPTAQVSAITGNILWLMGQGPAGLIEPAVSNLATVTPAGS